jgi:UDP-N-acetylglucosamine--N-acetylmuramyl-(pentapeptide) pyrophosphoryl-undecaprenol N-acetylglucosamine transferase
MSTHSGHARSVAVACGGTGGHLFPGLAVAQKLVRRGCEVTLLVSPKEVDQQAVKNVGEVQVVTLPAVCLKRGGQIAFFRGCAQSYRAARRLFKSQTPQAVLAMGGFTSAPPILAGKALGARTFLHESNTIPGRANRWLSWVVDHAFVGFTSATGQLKRCRVSVSGTPVRPNFRPRDAASCRIALGLDPARPVVLVMGGSQGASGLNEIVARALPLFAKLAPDWQWFHLAGPNDASQLQQTYAEHALSAIVHPFFDRMELALGAASAAISRAGASSLAELAAMRLPALLVPYPAATDNHQWHNASAYATTGAARLVEQGQVTPEALTNLLLDLVRSDAVRRTMQAALARWGRPDVADQIAESILEAISAAEPHKPGRFVLGPVPGTSLDRPDQTARSGGPFVAKPSVSTSQSEQALSI